MLGRKTGSGFYKYEGKEQMPNEAIEQWRRLRKSLQQIQRGTILRCVLFT